METLSPNIATYIALFGSRFLHGQEDLWKTTRRFYGRLECEFGYLKNVHEYHSSSSSFISEETKTRFYITRRTISGTLWDNYLVKLNDWFVNSQKFLVQKTQEIVGFLEESMQGKC